MKQTWQRAIIKATSIPVLKDRPVWVRMDELKFIDGATVVETNLSGPIFNKGTKTKPSGMSVNIKLLEFLEGPGNLVEAIEMIPYSEWSQWK